MLLHPAVTIPKLNVLLQAALYCWKRCCQRANVAHPYAPRIPLVGLPYGDPFTLHTRLQLTEWTAAGTTTMGDCFHMGVLIPIDDLMSQIDLPHGQFLTYHSLTQTFGDFWRSNSQEPQTHGVLQALITLGAARHLIKWLYRALLDILENRGPLLCNAACYT